MLVTAPNLACGASVDVTATPLALFTRLYSILLTSPASRSRCRTSITRERTLEPKRDRAEQIPEYSKKIRYSIFDIQYSIFDSKTFGTTISAPQLRDPPRTWTLSNWATGARNVETHAFERCHQSRARGGLPLNSVSRGRFGFLDGRRDC